MELIRLAINDNSMLSLKDNKLIFGSCFESSDHKFDMDISAFLLSDCMKVWSIDDFVYYNNLRSKNGSVVSYGDDREGGIVKDCYNETINVDLSRIESDVTHIVLVASISNAINSITFKNAENAVLSLYDSTDAEELAYLDLVSDFGDDSSVEFAVLHKNADGWGLELTGTGHQKSLEALSVKYITIDNIPDFSKKSTYTRASLVRRPDALVFDDDITLSLNWNRDISIEDAKSIFELPTCSIDLDLGVFVELNDGSKYLIDTLQFAKGRGGPKDILSLQGCYSAKPWVWHHGDAKGNRPVSEEKITVNKNGAVYISRIDVYVNIYCGICSWKMTNAEFTLNIPGIEVLHLKMNELSDIKHPFCVIAQILFSKTSVELKKILTSFEGHRECSDALGWGLKFKPGTKEK